MQKLFPLMKAAYSLRQGEEYRQALALYQQVIQQAPGYSLAYVFLGLTYQELGEKAEAEKAFRQALMIDPDNSQAIQSMGLFLLSQDRFPEAIGYLTQHLKSDSANEATLDVLIPVLSNTNRFDEAQVILNAAWEKTKSADVARRYARFLLSFNQVEKARDFLLTAIEISPSAHLLVELALTLVIEEKYQEAIRVLEQALQLRADYDRALRGLAHCYTQLNDGKKAIEMADRALAIDPRHYRNWQAKGDALLLEDRYQEAADAAQTGINLIDPKDGEALPVLAVLLIQQFTALLHMGRIDEALDRMGDARKIFPNDVRYYLYPANVLLKIDRPAEAMVIVKQAVDQQLLSEPEKQELLHQLANAAISRYVMGDIAISKEIFEVLAQMTPCESRFNTAYGYILIGESELAQAEAFFLRELENEQGESKGILYNDLGYIHLLQGQYDQAEKDFSTALNDEDTPAFLRVAYWVNGMLLPDYCPHPSRSSSIHLVALANQMALHLAQNNLARAGEVLKIMQVYQQEALLTLQAWGCLALAQGDPAKAREVWNHALRSAQDPREQKMMVDWLESIAG